MSLSPDGVLAYIAALVAHGGYTRRFASELETPGVRVPLSGSPELWDHALELGRRVIWLHTYGERFVDPAAGRPAGPPRLPDEQRPRPLVAIPHQENGMPETITYAEATRTLHVGAGAIGPVSPEVWSYEVSGMGVVRHWFGYRLYGCHNADMAAMSDPVSLAFISYRRMDSAAAARLLSSDLRAVFGHASVFIDTNDIRVGTDWRNRINERLRAASVLLVVIGPAWLRLADEVGRRHLDKPTDWVRNEIAHALDNGLVTVPVLISGADCPTREALPRRIMRLADQQAIKVRYESWDNDVNPLVVRLVDIGFRRIGSASPVRLPRPRIQVNALTETEIQAAVHRLPGWQIESSPIPGKEPARRLELMKAFEFASFEDAMQFMSEAASYITTFKHHPRWENQWLTVKVWLTTWDIGHKPSGLDLALARYLDDLFVKFKEPSLE